MNDSCHQQWFEMMQAQQKGEKKNYYDLKKKYEDCLKNGTQ